MGHGALSKMRRPGYRPEQDPGPSIFRASGCANEVCVSVGRVGLRELNLV